MKKDLKGYVRIDARGRIVPGSLVLRRKRPANDHNGTFIEVQTYQCCIPPGDPGGTGAPTTVALPTLTGGAPNYHIEISIGNLTTGDIDTGTTTGAALVTYLTTNYASEGTYVLSGTNVIFTPTTPGVTLAITAGA